MGSESHLILNFESLSVKFKYKIRSYFLLWNLFRVSNKNHLLKFMLITFSLGLMVWWVVIRGFPAPVRFDRHLKNVRYRSMAEK